MASRLQGQCCTVSALAHLQREDLSCNNARVSDLWSDQPVMQTFTGPNTAGAYNGGGIGNKCIFGFRGFNGTLVSSITVP